MLALKFSSVVFGVTSRLTVTNKIHWYVVRRLSHVINKRRCLQIPAMSVANLPRSGASLFTTPDGLIVDNTKKRDIGRKERFFIPHLHHSTLPLGGARRNIATTFVMKKTRTAWLSDREKSLKIWLLVLVQCTNLTNSKTDGLTVTAQRHRPRLCIASRGINKVAWSAVCCIARRITRSLLSSTREHTTFTGLEVVITPSLESTPWFFPSASPVMSRLTSSFTCQLISIIITTLTIHLSFTFSLQARNLLFQQILPTVDFFYLPDCLHDNGTGPDLSCSSFYF